MFLERDLGHRPLVRCWEPSSCDISTIRKVPIFEYIFNAYYLPRKHFHHHNESHFGFGTHMSPIKYDVLNQATQAGPIFRYKDRRHYPEVTNALI